MHAGDTTAAILKTLDFSLLSEFSVGTGVSEHTAMSITGHKTASIFRRYDIQTEDDLATAIERVGEHLSGQPKTPAKVVPIRAAG
jgi:hypothetical protein